MYHGQDEGWGGRNGREECFPKPLWRPSKFPGYSSEKNLKQNLGRGWWLGNYNYSDQLRVLLLLQFGSELSDSVEWWLHAENLASACPLQGPWNAGFNQQTGHQGSLDILKMCFRYLGKSADAFFQCPYRVAISHGQWDTSGTASTHGTTLFRSPGQSTSGLQPAVWLRGGGNWKHKGITLYRLQGWKSGTLGAWKPIE